MLLVDVEDYRGALQQQRTQLDAIPRNRVLGDSILNTIRTDQHAEVSKLYKLLQRYDDLRTSMAGNLRLALESKGGSEGTGFELFLKKLHGMEAVPVPTVQAFLEGLAQVVRTDLASQTLKNYSQDFRHSVQDYLVELQDFRRFIREAREILPVDLLRVQHGPGAAKAR